LSNSPNDCPGSARDSQAREHEDGRVENPLPVTPFTYILTPATLEEQKWGIELIDFDETVMGGRDGGGNGESRRDVLFFPFTITL
jgi:hypothetical protein